MAASPLSIFITWTGGLLVSHDASSTLCIGIPRQDVLRNVGKHVRAGFLAWDLNHKRLGEEARPHAALLR